MNLYICHKISENGEKQQMQFPISALTMHVGAQLCSKLNTLSNVENMELAFEVFWQQLWNWKKDVYIKIYLLYITT